MYCMPCHRLHVSSIHKEVLMSDVSDAMPSETACWYLPDSSRMLNKTQVYVTTQLNSQIDSLEAAMRFLRERSPSSLSLRRVSGEGLTVVFEACARPRIRIGRSAPRQDPDEDVKEILSVLASHGIQCQVEGA